MAKYQHSCKSCGYKLEDANIEMCLPCFIVDVKRSMLITPSNAISSSETLGRSKKPRAGESSPLGTKKKTKKIKTKAPKSGGHVTSTSGTDNQQFLGKKSRNTGRISFKLNCVLCGKSVSKGDLLAHKQEFHGEKIVSDSPSRSRSRSGWVRVVSGGLPSLGKRR